MTICPQCGSLIKTIPAGISRKTGKPYDAFQICSNNDCQWRPPKPKAPPATNTTEDLRTKFLIEAYKKNASRQDIEIDLQMLLDIYARKPAKQADMETANDIVDEENF